MSRTISLHDGSELIVGESGSKPPRAVLRRLQRRIRKSLDHTSVFEWEGLAESLCSEPVGAAWTQVELWREIVSRESGDPRSSLHLADALVEAGELDEALEAARRFHEEQPDWMEGSELVVKLMVFLGHDYREFSGAALPRVAALDATTRTRCRERILRHGAADALELILEIFGNEVVLFSSEELAAFLGQDPALGLDGEIVFEAPGET